MRLILFALIIGCAALVCKLTAQPDVVDIFDLHVVSTATPDVRSSLSLMGFDFPVVQAASRTAEAPAKAPSKAKPTGKGSKLDDIIQKSARKHGVPATFVRSIIAAESNYNARAVSGKGAVGLMQLMPSTAQSLGADPRIPEQNVDAGTRYLRQLMNKYKDRRDPLKHVIAAYNAGPGNVDRFKGVPPFRETRTYVKRVMGYLQEFEGTPKGTQVTFASITADGD